MSLSRELLIITDDELKTPKMIPRVKSLESLNIISKQFTNYLDFKWCIVRIKEHLQGDIIRRCHTGEGSAITIFNINIGIPITLNMGFLENKNISISEERPALKNRFDRLYNYIIEDNGGYILQGEALDRWWHGTISNGDGRRILVSLRKRN